MKQYTYPNWQRWPKDRSAIIAEIGMNHGGDEGLAWEMIVAAHENGADFVKLQSYVTSSFLHPSLGYYNNTKSMELSTKVQKNLFERSKEKGIELITTPYDIGTAELVESFSPAAYKVASMDNNNFYLIDFIASFQRPIMVSCGMATLDEIHRMMNNVTKTNNKLVLCHCISNYPAKDDELNLNSIDLLNQTFNVFIGYSDHSIGLEAPKIAIAMGAVAIEKHFTTDKKLAEKYPDADHDISITPNELKQLYHFAKKTSIMSGKSPRQLTENEKQGRLAYRRGIYASKDIKSGTKLSLDNICFLRPAKGISVSEWNNINNKKVISDIKKHQPIFNSDLGE